jgi:hypothetical protein
MLHKDYDREGSVAKKISGRESQGAWRQDELIGGKPPILKWLWVEWNSSSEAGSPRQPPLAEAQEAEQVDWVVISINK